MYFDAMSWVVAPPSTYLLVILPLSLFSSPFPALVFPSTPLSPSSPADVPRRNAPPAPSSPCHLPPLRITHTPCSCALRLHHGKTAGPTVHASPVAAGTRGRSGRAHLPVRASLPAGRASRALAELRFPCALETRSRGPYASRPLHCRV